MEEILSQIDKYDDGTDEDKLLKTIFDYHIRLNPSETISIAELIISNKDTQTENREELKILSRQGIRFYEKDSVKYLAIARNHTHLKKILSDTIYSGRYEEVLKRHNFSEAHYPAIRFAGVNTRAILLQWDKVKAKYFDDVDDSDVSNLFDVF